MLFFNGLFEPLRREIALQPPSCFGCLQYASSTASSVLSPARFYSLSGSTKRIAQRPLLSRIDFISSLLLSPSLLGESRLLSFSLSLSVLLTHPTRFVDGFSQRYWSLLPRTLCFPARTKLFPHPPPISPLLSNPNRLVTRSNYRWQTWKLIAGGRQAATAAATRR